MREVRKAHVAPEPEHPEEHRHVAEDLVPAVAHRREPPELRVDLPRSGPLPQAHLGRADGLHLLEERPLRHLVLEPLLRLGEPVGDLAPEDPVRDLILRRLDGVRAEELLGDDLEPLPLRRRRSEELARKRHRLVEPRALLGLQPDDDALPGLVLLRLPGDGSLHRDVERPDRLDPRPRDPRRFLFVAGHGEDRVGLARGDLAAPDRLAQERPLAKLAREPRHLPGGAGRDPEPLAGVVADVAEAEREDALPDPERAEPLADRDLDRAAAPGEPDEEPVEEQPRLVAQDVLALVRKRRLERPRCRRERVEAGLRDGESAAHGHLG